MCSQRHSEVTCDFSLISQISNVSAILGRKCRARLKVNQQEAISQKEIVFRFRKDVQSEKGLLGF